jgi:hypothetical protein
MESLMEVADYQYLIIPGVPKAATSSLFSYLAEHPAICGGYIKETCFFLDSDYPTAQQPLRADYFFADGLESFSKYYRDCTDAGQVRLDATPDYLYSPGTARRIADALPNSRLVFVLREPISRLISYYGFAKQRDKIDQSLSFDEYVRLIHEGRDRDRFPFDALGHGRYSDFLASYYEVFPRDRILVFFYEELLGDAKAVTQSVCRFIGVSPEFYDTFQFNVYNKTYSLRYPQVYSAVIHTRHLLRKLTYRSKIHSHFQRARNAFEKRLFELIKETSPQRPNVSSDTRKFLVDYYYGNNRERLADLERLLGRPVPWMTEPAGQRQSQAK